MKAQQADILGIISAGLCIVHCLLVPAFIVYGVISDTMSKSWEYLDWVFIALSWTAVFSATRHESNYRLVCLMWSILIIFTITLLIHDFWTPALYLSAVSSLGLAALHLLHFRKKENKHRAAFFANQCSETTSY